MGEVAGVVSQIMSGSEIDWGQVAFNGVIGMASGALMASPLGAASTGLFIAALTFTQSVGNDLFENNGNWGKVNWQAASLTSMLSGIVSGAGKYFLQNTTLMNKFINSRASVQAAAGVSSLGRASYMNFWEQMIIARGVYTYGIKIITSIVNGLVKLI